MIQFSRLFDTREQVMAKEKTYIEVTVRTKPTTLIERIEFAPVPTSVEYGSKKFVFPKQFYTKGLNPLQAEHFRTIDTLATFFDSLGGKPFNVSSNGYEIQFVKPKKAMAEEEYSLSIKEDGAKIISSSAAGFFYGAQTLIQVFASCFYVGLFLGSHVPAESDAFEKRWVPEIEISDKPSYQLRSFMVDLGRATFSLPFLKRIVRIMSQLKMNVLHVHAFDDQLCGLKFKKLPLGSENPYAITLDELGDLVQYAKGFHVKVMPELESWGHVQSVIYHFPEVYGCPGMWGGMSFGIGKKTYDLLGKIYDEVLEVLDDETMVHVGMDEANWTVLDQDKNKGHTPTNMVQKIYDLLQSSAKKHKKQVAMHLWADHGGRPLPEKIKNKIVIEPWKYRHNDEAKIVANMQVYGGEGKTPVMMGGGWSSGHLEGSYEATRIWTREGLKYPNVVGITNCMWEGNDLEGQLIGLYGGACYSWNPKLPTNNPDRDPLWEDVRCNMFKRMRHWQHYFVDARAERMNADRGEEVRYGRFAFGSRAGEVVAPTVDFHLRFRPSKNKF